MVWGLEEPTGTGICFPDGEYPGWKDQLEIYFRTEMPEEEKARIGARFPQNYVTHVSRKFEREVGSTYYSDKDIVLDPLLPHECPGEYRAERTMKELGALIDGHGVYVSEPLKDIIEALEPGVHFYWPMRMTGPKGVEYPVRYYGMQVRRFFHSFRPELSEPGSWREAPNQSTPRYTARGDTKAVYAGLAISEAEVAGAHIWRERHLQRPNLLISDTLQAEIKKAGLKVWKHNRMKSV
ncbi:MAG: hypothetical protein HC844_16050 [Tabrizicola sp.]|nr:hypothetical protein [Tabrizicola sp.]